MCLYKEVQLKGNSNKLDRPAACDISQQYFSDTFVSLRFHFHKEKKLLRV
jgi:hypothetical protein